MRPRLRAIIGVAIMSVLLVLYFGFAGVRAFALLGSSEPIAVVMGVALLILPIIGFWALLRELAFGFRSTQLVDVLSGSGELPEELVETQTSGLPLREAADGAFSRYREAAEHDATNWRAWMRLGLVYDAAGDRKRARSAIRQAISLNRNEIRTISSQD